MSSDWSGRESVPFAVTAVSVRGAAGIDAEPDAVVGGAVGRSAARRWAARLAGAGVLLSLALGCADLGLLGGSTPDDAVVAARAELDGGDLVAAAKSFEALRTEYPESVDVAVGQSYMQVLSGDLAGADATLASIEPFADPAALQQVKLRRALVALREQDLDRIKLHGMASGLPEGRLLAAEVHLVDLEREEGTAILKELAGEGGAVGQTASTYTEMLSGDSALADLAEVTALWALGVRESACEAAEDLVKQLPADFEGKDEMLLLWASRAVTSGKPGVARSLLDDVTFPPSGQEWRLRATQAMIALADGDTETGLALFNSLKEAAAAGDVPADGVRDALATACFLTDDATTRDALVGDLRESAAAARCLLDAGDAARARDAAPAGKLKMYLERM